MFSCVYKINVIDKEVLCLYILKKIFFRESNVSRENFRAAIFDVVVFLTKHPLSGNARKLILHYFNESNGETAKECAYEAIEKYFSEELPVPEAMPRRLASLLQRMEREADEWDNE